MMQSSYIVQLTSQPVVTVTQSGDNQSREDHETNQVENHGMYMYVCRYISSYI